MNFTYLEKKAVVGLLITLARIDGLADPNELSLINDKFKEDMSFYQNSMEIPFELASATVENMSFSKKLDFGKLLLEVAGADGKVDVMEDKMIKILFHKMGILELLIIK